MSAGPLPAAAAAAPGVRVADLAELAKARIQVMAVGAALAAAWLAGGNQLPVGMALNLVIGMVLTCTGAAALNQVIEAPIDALMARTRNRPIPAGRMSRETALVFALGTAVAGTTWLTWTLNPLTGVLALAMLVLYDFVYTPLKRHTSLNTVIGAIPGAMPVLVGWAAAGQGLGPIAWILFGILFLWQFPHFMAVAWIHREDYARAGLAMLPVVPMGDSMSRRQAVLYALALVPVSLLPAFSAGAGSVYFFGALLLSLSFLAFALRFWLGGSLVRARSLMRASLVYLPLLLVLLLVESARAAS